MEENRVLVKNMLKKLVDIGDQITWRINNSYADGIDKTILEILIYQKGFQSGRIAFQAETGQVLNYRYKKMKKRIPIQISDILLDIMSAEMTSPIKSALS